jgi:hypothetical protein
MTYQSSKEQQLDSDKLKNKVYISISEPKSSPGFNTVCSKEWFTVGVLCFINLKNFMDRFSMAGELKLVISHKMPHRISRLCKATDNEAFTHLDCSFRVKLL